ncbi:hypothetical protein Tco_0371183, partial [Tanacetum coccineum]
MISMGSSTELSLSSSRSSFIGMMRVSSNRHFFKLETWKVLWTLLSSSGSSSLYGTGPTLSRIFNGPMYRGLSFPGFRNRMTPFRACKCCRICTIFSVVSWIIYGPLRMSNTSDKGTTFEDGAARVGSSKVSTYFPLVSPSTIINVPRELYSIDVAATFRVPLTTVGDLQKLINDIDASKHDELLSELTNKDR